MTETTPIVLSAAHFEPLAGEVFAIAGGERRLTLRKIETSGQAGDGFRAPFTLIFDGPAGDVLPEGFYIVMAKSGASFGLHIMPVHTPARDRQDYQAAFN